MLAPPGSPGPGSVLGNAVLQHRDLEHPGTRRVWILAAPTLPRPSLLVPGLSQLRAAPTATSGTRRVEKRQLLKPESPPCPGTKLHIFLRLTTGSFAKHFHH